MANIPTGAPSVVGDDAFNQFLLKLVFDFETRFEAWAARATSVSGGSSTSSESSASSSTGTLGDIIKHGPLSLSATSDTTVDSVYDLGRLCRDFIFGDVWAWAFLLRRQGSTVNDVMKLVAEHAAQTETATYERKWLVGVRQIKHHAYVAATYGTWTIEEEPWVRAAWTVVVEETIAEFVVDCLQPALARASTPGSAYLPAISRSATSNRDKVDEFIVRVMRETGERITRRDIALLAGGYRTLTELQRFQRNDPRLGNAAKKNITRALQMTATDVLSELPSRRAAAQRRILKEQATEH
jgi:hypothetical protein